MKRALLIDTTNNFIRNYMVNSATTINSIPAGGAVGIVNTLKKSILKLKPDIVICVWDGENGSVQKRRLLKEYKAGRKPRLIVGQSYEFSDQKKVEENKDWQRHLSYELIDYLPVCQMATSGYEADDAIGYIASNKEYFGFKSAIILSSDKDFYQLLDDEKVVIYNPIKDQLITKKTVLEEEEIHPSNWLLYRSIVGDKSDNIKGVKGIGPKKMKKLFDLKEPIDFSNECASVESKDKKSWHYKTLKKLMENEDTISLNQKIMNLKNPMMSISHKDFVTGQISDFRPSLKTKDLYLKIMKEQLPLPNNLAEFFRVLVAKA